MHGLGGVGKTRAAIEYAWRHVDDYSALLFVSAPSVAELRANLANLNGVFGMAGEGIPVEQQLAAVLRWLDDHPGWLLIIDNVNTEEAAREVEAMLASLRSGHVLITSQIGHWSAGVERLELSVLDTADAVAYLMQRAVSRRKTLDDDAQAATDRVRARRPGRGAGAGRCLHRGGIAVLRRVPRTLAGPAGGGARMVRSAVDAVPAECGDHLGDDLYAVAGTVATAARGAGLAGARADPADAAGCRAAGRGRRRAPQGAGALKRYSLARFDATGEAVVVHRLVQEIARRPRPEADDVNALRIALKAVNAVAPFEANDVRTWDVWTPLSSHVEAVTRFADAAGLPEPSALLMNQLGLYWHARGLFDTAEPLFRRALVIGERSYGHDHPNVASGLNNLAEVLRATGRFGEAEPLFRRSLAIYERSYGHDHPNVATALNNLARLLGDTGRLGEAEPLFRRSLAIDERSNGPNHPSVARDLNNLAGLLGTTGRLGEAEPLYRRSLAIYERSYGPDDPNVATALNNLARLLEATGRLGEAEPLYRRGLQILIMSQRRTRHQNRDFRAGLTNYGLFLKSTGKTPEEIKQHLLELVRSVKLQGA